VHLTIATAGHIDHGKSALVQALTGTHPDRLKEEQARGISIELGFAHTQFDGVVLSFIDVPGHERFVRTMLAGIGGIDAVLFVVAADESVMPQTREHLDICALLGVPRGVIALTKCDVADETIQAIAEDDVRTLVAPTFLSDAPIVRVSARTGLGLEPLRAALRTAAGQRTTRDAGGGTRLPIDRVFSVKGFGTVVTGTLWSGTLRADEPLTLLRADGQPAQVRARGLQVHGTAADRADAGQRVALNLASVALDDVSRGDVLVSDDAVLVSTRLGVHVQVLPDAPPQRHGTRVHVHLGTTSVLGRLLVPMRDDSGRRSEMASGAVTPARLRLEAPLPVRRGDRLVLRAYSPLATIAGAVVDDPRPLLRTAAAAAPVSDPVEWLAARIEEAAGFGVADVEVTARCGVSRVEAVAMTERLVSAGRIVRAGDFWVSAAHLDALADDLVRRIEARDQVRWEGGMPRAELKQILARRHRPAIVELVLARLAATGAITGDARLTTKAEAMAGAEAALAGEVLEAVSRAGLQGPTASELESLFAGRLDRKALATVLARQGKAGKVERVGEIYVARQPLDALAEGLRREAAHGQVPARIDVGWFKDRYGLTRKSAIPLLEWLDRTRVTRRDGDARVLVAGK